jgi:hypothetical protein
MCVPYSRLACRKVAFGKQKLREKGTFQPAEDSLRFAWFRIAEHHVLSACMTLVICANIALMGCVYDGQPASFRAFIDGASTLFTVIYAVEAGVKLIGLSPLGYALSARHVPWTQFACLLSTLTLQLLLKRLEHSGFCCRRDLDRIIVMGSRRRLIHCDRSDFPSSREVNTSPPDVVGSWVEKGASNARFGSEVLAIYPKYRRPAAFAHHCVRADRF